MAEWWKSKARKEREENLAQSRKLAEQQPASLLQSFIDFANAHKDTYGLGLWVTVLDIGKISIHFQFTDEKEFQFNLSTEVSFTTQKDPERLINRLYTSNRLNHVIAELQRMENVKDEIVNDRERIEEVYVKLVDSLDLERIQEMAELRKNIIKKQEELDSYLPKIWVNSPYLAERVHMVYKAFLRQNPIEPKRPTDPVELDLLAILEDVELSLEVRTKAEMMLATYREEKRVSMERNQQEKEQQALLILSTIETHYLKGGREDGYLAEPKSSH